MQIYSNLSDIFEIEEYDYNRVILKVKADTPLKVAKYPFVSGEWEYITVTRGKDHILTVIKKDGTTFDFHWGYSGYTLISENLELLKANVVHFIENENAILLDYIGKEPEEVGIFYNDNYKSWQISFNTFHFWNKDIKSAEEMIEYADRFVKATEWKNEKAVTGIDVWRAVNPIFVLK